MLEARFVSLDRLYRPVVWPAVVVLDHGRSNAPGFADRVRFVNGLQRAEDTPDDDLPVMNALARWADAIDWLVAIRALPDAVACTLAPPAFPPVSSAPALRRMLSSCAVEIRGRTLSDLVSPEVARVADDLLCIGISDLPQIVTSALAACSPQTLVDALQSCP
jgi:hypothetical protein